MKKLKPVNVLDTVKKQTIITGFAGLAAGLLYSVGGLIIDILVTLGVVYTTETPGLSHGTILAFGAIPIMSLYFAAFGVVTGLAGALLYNLFVKVVNRK